MFLNYTAVCDEKQVTLLVCDSFLTEERYNRGMRRISEHILDWENDKTNDLVSSIEDFELEEIMQGRIATLEKYSGFAYALLLPAAQKELERRKEQRKEERTERLIKIAETRTTELLKILEHIARAISNKPKTALAVVILVPVAISALISLINFLGYQVWAIFIAPYLNDFGVPVR